MVACSRICQLSISQFLNLQCLHQASQHLSIQTVGGWVLQDLPTFYFSMSQPAVSLPNQPTISGLFSSSLSQLLTRATCAPCTPYFATNSMTGVRRICQPAFAKHSVYLDLVVECCRICQLSISQFLNLQCLYQISQRSVDPSLQVCLNCLPGLLVPHAHHTLQRTQ